MTTSRFVNAVAPIRVCDNGGWTDTWFAERGAVCNVAVYPYVEVQVRVAPRTGDDPPVVLHAENYGERYAFAPSPEPLPGRHPLLEAAVDEMGVPDDVAVDIAIHSEAPAGCSTGTSAAVTVALIGALDRLTPGAITPLEVARVAHRLETDRLGLQSGIQDQLCSASGGINFIEMPAYPEATVERLEVPNPLWWELERRLMLVFLGRTHDSSAVHLQVIDSLQRDGAGAAQLEELRQCAATARDAILGGDLDAYGRSMQRNTEAQRGLHPSLVNADAECVIALAREHGAIGWKVNGAGGEGGSVTLLCGPSAGAKRILARAITEANQLYQVIPTYLSRFGLRVWES